MRAPVILIGMHRSGTSLLTRTLRQNGLFMGADTGRNDESKYFNRINEWLLRQSGASWERPEGLDDLTADAEIRPLLRDYIAGITRGPSAWGYLGWRRGWRGLEGLREVWGWKDPRNSFTLPIWMELFPDAKVLHILRHGVDVAASLRTRRSRAMVNSAERYRGRAGWYHFQPKAPKTSGFGHQPRVGRLDGGLDLWLEYGLRARKHVTELGSQALELQYEQLLTRPGDVLPQVLDFCELAPSAAQTERAIAAFRPDRAFSYRNDPELSRFAANQAETLARLGY